MTSGSTGIDEYDKPILDALEDPDLARANRDYLRGLYSVVKSVAKGVRLYDLLEADDFEGLRELIHGFYAGIPHEWYTNNEIATYEGYYAAVFYAYFASLGLDVRVEDSTNRGRLDMAVRFGGAVFVFEFKVVEQAGAGTALAGERLRREVPGPGRIRAPGRCRVQQRDAQHRAIRRVPGVLRLTGVQAVRNRPAPTPCACGFGRRTGELAGP